MRQTLRLNAKKSTSAPRVGSPQEHKQLHAAAKKWIKKLELGAPVWQSISLFFASPEELPGCVGHCDFSTEHRSAEILVLHPELLEPHTKETGQTWEHILVHELLHLVLDGHKPAGKYDAQHEAAINLLARVLLKK